MKRETVLQALTVAVLLWLCFLAHSCASGDPNNLVPGVSEITRPPLVLAGLSGCIKADEASFAVRGPCKVGDVEYPDGIQAKVSPAEGGLKIGDREFPGDSVRVQVQSDGTLEATIVEPRTNKVKARKYHGHLIVMLDRGKVTLANEVDVENYLAGVVGKEMSLSKGREALKCQVIAARTYAMCEVKNGRLRKVNGEKFDLYDDERSQVYGGTEAETDLAREIVAETRGMFVVWEGTLVNTFYSACCGGYTDAAWKVLEEGRDIPPLRGTKCGSCDASPHFAWEAKIARAEMAEKLFPEDKNLKVKAVRILEALPGGHAVKVAVELEGHPQPRMLHANKEFRRRLKLKSSLILSIDEQGDALVIKGRGWGHGAGMCQWGAYAMAAEGKSGVEILEHYFPGAKVKKIY